jgi:citrate synthase
MNVDGVIGAIVADMGLSPMVATLVFILGRVAGLSAHYFEEVNTFPPMRWIHFAEAVYVAKSADRPRSRRYEDGR